MSQQSRNLEQAAMKMTRWVGTPASLIFHTALFVVFFLLPFFGVALDSILLVLTTVVSLEAIYLAIFIQLTVNRNTQSLEEVGEDIEEIHEDVKGIESDVDEISKDVEEISEDVEDISEDVDRIHGGATRMTIEKIEGDLQKVVNDLEALKRQK